MKYGLTLLYTYFSSFKQINSLKCTPEQNSSTISFIIAIEIRYFFPSPAIYQASHFITLYHILRKISRLSQKNKSL